MPQVLTVFATWDPDAGVWVAESEDIPGLITEAASVDALRAKLDDIIPVLLEENDGVDLPEVPISIMWKTTQTVRLNRA